jgi:hypothetical protein
MDVINKKLQDSLQDGGTYRMKEHQILFPNSIRQIEPLPGYQNTLAESGILNCSSATILFCGIGKIFFPILL